MRRFDPPKGALVFVPLPAVAVRLGYKCVKSVKRLIDRGGFPEPVVSGGQLCIVESELNAYMQRRLQNRRQDVEKFRSRRVDGLERFKARQAGESGV